MNVDHTGAPAAAQGRGAEMVSRDPWVGAFAGAGEGA